MGLQHHTRLRPRAVSAVALMAALVAPAWVQAQAQAQTQTPVTGIPENSFATNFPANGDADGRRKALAEKGVTYGLNYVGEWQANVAGGLKRGSGYMGRLESVLDVDLEKRAGLAGLSFHGNVFSIHGKGLTEDKVGSLASVSYLEAKPTTRLSEAWLEQKFFGGMASVRAGQLAADTEFGISSYATQFINGTFGWPTLMASALPSGGPAYPFATPGARIKLDPNANVSLLAALYNGDPAGPGTGDPQTRNRFGLNFRLQDSPLLITEGQVRVNQDKGASGLAGSYKLGAFSHFGSFNDQRFGTDGLALADPASNGLPLQRRGNHGVYAVIDQQLWRPKSGEPDKGIGFFVHGMASPSDRNLLDLYVDGGVVFAGLWAARPDDVLSFGAAYARISDGARASDADAIRLGTGALLRNAERLLEINYQAQVMAGWQMDLDLQRIISPAGGAASPADATGRTPIPSATVLTLHNAFKY